MATRRTQADIASLDTPGTYRFGPGLFLQVKNAESKSWIYRFTVGGANRWMGLGSVRDVTLAKAREKLEDVRVNFVRKKIDPLAVQRDHDAKARGAEADAIPFRLHALNYMDAHASKWRNAKHRAQWESTLRAYVYPTIGDMPAKDVKSFHVVEALRPIWAKRTTAMRVKGRIRTVLDFAAGADVAAYINPADISAARLKLLLGEARAPKRKFPALPYQQMAEFMAALAERDGNASRCLEFSILTVSRPGMAVGAIRREFDVARRSWIIPAERMKAGWDHVVPLSDAAFALIAARLAERVTPNDILFPASDGGMLSDAGMAAAIKRLNATRVGAGLAAFIDPHQGGRFVVPHGFRSSFTDWAGDATDFDVETREFALAHGISDQTVASYRRSSGTEKRTRMMEAWASYCGRPASVENVVKLRA